MPKGVPTFQRVDESGMVTNEFEGKISAQGIDIPAAPDTFDPSGTFYNQSNIEWSREAGAWVARIRGVTNTGIGNSDYSGSLTSLVRSRLENIAEWGAQANQLNSDNTSRSYAGLNVRVPQSGETLGTRVQAFAWRSGIVGESPWTRIIVDQWGRSQFLQVGAGNPKVTYVTDQIAVSFSCGPLGISDNYVWVGGSRLAGGAVWQPLGMITPVDYGDRIITAYSGWDDNQFKLRFANSQNAQTPTLQWIGRWIRWG